MKIQQIQKCGNYVTFEQVYTCLHTLITLVKLVKKVEQFQKQTVLYFKRVFQTFLQYQIHIVSFGVENKSFNFFEWRKPIFIMVTTNEFIYPVGCNPTAISRFSETRAMKTTIIILL